jgi:high-affinity nickel permease
MSAILVLGFLLGMRHALEADHIAAVATLAIRNRSHRKHRFHGVSSILGTASSATARRSEPLVKPYC